MPALTDDDYVKLARNVHHEEGSLEIDDADVKVSRADDNSGAYVQAWVWVDNPNTDDEDEHVVKLSSQQLAAVLAALRIAQDHMDRFTSMPHFDDEGLAPMSAEDIDDLCEQINVGE